MPSHHTQKAIDLHHAQVNAGQTRKQMRQSDRLLHYLTLRHEARLERGFVLSIAFIWFAYMQIATALYLGYVT